MGKKVAMQAGEESPRLIFDWRKPERRWPALAKWFMATLAGMVIFSYVFKVIYPQALRTIPAPQQITLLNPEDPAMSSLLHRVADQDYLIIPDGHGTGTVRLEDQMPVFHPTYENHQYQLQDPPHQTFTVPPVRLLDPTAPVLPPPDLSRLKPPAARPESGSSPQLSVVFNGALAGRKILHAPDFSRLQLADPEAWRIHVGVDYRGRVAFALPVSTEEPAALTGELVSRLSELRFDPGPAAGAAADSPEQASPITWDIASFRWTKPTSP